MSTSTTARRVSSLWRNPAWHFGLPAAVISRAGDICFDLTVVLWISVGLAPGVSWAPAAVAGVLAAGTVSTLIAGPLAGVLVDRVDGQRAIQVANMIQFVAIASLILPATGVVAVATPATLVWIYASVLVSNAAGQAYIQARTVMIATAIPGERHASAYAQQTAANSILGIVIPAASAPLYFLAGPAVALSANAVTFLVSAILHSRFRWARQSVSTERTSYVQDLKEGLAAVLRNRQLRAIIALLCITSGAGGIVSVLEIFFLTQALNAPASLLGILNGVFAGGTVLGIAIAPRASKRFQQSKILGTCVIVSGVAVVAYSVNTLVPLAYVLYGLIAIPIGTIIATLPAFAVKIVPKEVLGRAMGMLNVLPAVFGMGTTAIAAWLSSGPLMNFEVQLGSLALGTISVLFFATGVLMAAGGAALLPALRSSQVPSNTPAAP